MGEDSCCRLQWVAQGSSLGSHQDLYLCSSTMLVIKKKKTVNQVVISNTIFQGDCSEVSVPVIFQLNFILKIIEEHVPLAALSHHPGSFDGAQLLFCLGFFV